MEVKEFFIDEECTMLEAMALLDKTAKKVLFVTRESKLLAAITDGDIRRWLLKKGDQEAKVKDIANYNPKYLRQEHKADAKAFMKKYSIEALPILDEEDNIISIVLWNDEEVKPKRNLKVPVVIMAGGRGTRLYPYTKILPKPLIPVGEVPIVEHIMNHFNQYGSDHFYLVVNHKRNMIKAYFSETRKDYKITYIDEEKPLGTGGGLSLLKGQVESTFILTNCDILIEEDYEKIYKLHKKENNLITIICSLKKIRIPYGVIEIGEHGEVKEIKEKPELSFFTNTGMYIVEPKIIEELEENKDISFPEIIEHYKSQGEKIGIFPISENNWLDMGQFDSMEVMKRKLECDE